MTLREALNTLNRSGKIRSEFLPGMVIGWFYRGVPQGGARIVRVLPSTFMGVDAWRLTVTLGAEADRLERHTDIVTNSRNTEITGINTSDPATVGCLAALAREASGDPSLHAVFGDPLGWLVDGPGLPAGYIEYSVGEAWAAALIALAGGYDE